MSKIILPDITSGYNLSAINSNFQKIEDELNNKVLYRQIQDGEPNAMSENLDMNSNRIINLPDAVSESEPVTLRQLISVDSGDALALRAELASTGGVGLIGVATYAGIRSYTGDSTTIKCGGRENVFDGASGVFRVKPGDMSSDNDITVLVDALGRRWKRIYYGPVRPEWAGAKRDGVSDDSVAMQKCIDLFSNIELSEGSYRFASPIIITTGSGLTITGAGKTKTLIRKDNLTAPNLTRTYDGVTHTYNTPCIFALVAGNDSYVRHVVIEGVNTTGVEGDNTQVHYYAPRVTYSVFDKLEGAYGKSLFDSSLVSFVNSFKDSRSILMSRHWNVIGGNAWSFENTYATGVPTSGGDSIAYYFEDTNVQLSGADGDGLNLCFVSDGFAKVTLLGCNSEARLRIVDSRGNSSVDVQGGRHAISVNPSQQSIEAAPYYAAGSSKISVRGAKAFGYAYSGAVPSNKFIAISSNDSSVALHDMDRTGNDTGFSFVLPDPAATTNGEVSIVEAGSVTFAVSPKVSASAGVGSISTISKSVDFATGLSKTLITAGTMAYNERMTAEVDLHMVSSGAGGANSVVSLRKLLIAASNRNTQTVVMSEQGSSISPDSAARTITLSATISGGVVSVTATASHADIGMCYVKFAIKSAIHDASGRVKPVTTS